MTKPVLWENIKSIVPTLGMLSLTLLCYLSSCDLRGSQLDSDETHLSDNIFRYLDHQYTFYVLMGFTICLSLLLISNKKKGTGIAILLLIAPLIIARIIDTVGML